MGFFGFGNQQNQERLRIKANLYIVVAIDLLRLPLWVYLRWKYLEKYPEETAGGIAGAIICELLTFEADPQQHKLYEDGLVQKEMEQLHNYGELTEVYTHAVRQFIATLYDAGQITANEMTNRYEKCASIGIYQPNIYPPSRNIDVIDVIRKFYNRVVGGMGGNFDRDFEAKIKEGRP